MTWEFNLSNSGNSHDEAGPYNIKSNDKFLLP